VHRIKRHLVTVSNIRDKSLQLSSRLLSSSLNMSCVSADESAGFELSVSESTPSGSNQNATWLIAKLNSASISRIRIIQRLLDVTSPLSQVGRSARSLKNSSIAALSDIDWNTNFRFEWPLSFPCILVRAKFDQFSIIHATYLFTTTDLCIWGDHFSAGASRSCPIFCAQDIFELCHSSNDHSPGMNIPLQTGGMFCSDSESPKLQVEDEEAIDDSLVIGADLDGARSNVKFNMMIPLAYTPLLFSLYKGKSLIKIDAIKLIFKIINFLNTLFNFLFLRTGKSISWSSQCDGRLYGISSSIITMG
jgi:hypothetical protein